MADVKFIGTVAIMVACFAVIYPRFMHPFFLKVFGFNDPPKHDREGPRIRESASAGQRPQQKTLKVGCNAKVRLKLQRPKDRQPYLEIVECVLDHSGHEVSEQLYKTYPEKKLASVQLDETTTVLTTAASLKTSELKSILERRHKVSLLTSDVHNLRRKLQGSSTDSTVCSSLANEIRHNGGFAQIAQSDCGNFKHFIFFTRAMQQMFQKYPETVVMDITYRTNKYLYPLLTAMVIDCEGHGIPVMHAYLRKEDTATLEHVLRTFGELNSFADTHCFVVDKDMAEIAAIGAVFPDIPVNLCHFHINQAVKRAMKAKVPADSMEKVVDLFMLQVYTESPDEFEELKDKLSNLIPTEARNYFETHWWRRSHLWATCRQANVVNLDVNTTNHLESYHNKIKAHLNEKITLSKSLSLLLNFDEKPSFSTFEGRYRKAKHVCDDIVNFLSVVGVAEFTEKIHHLEHLLQLWCSPVDENESLMATNTTAARVLLDLEHLLQLWCSPVDENESLMATNTTAARVVTLDPPLPPECTTGTATAAVTNTAIIPVTEQGVSPECFADTATTAARVVTLDPPLSPECTIGTASSTFMNTAITPASVQGVSPECFSGTASSTVMNTAIIPASVQGVSPECFSGTASSTVMNTAIIPASVQGVSPECFSGTASSTVRNTAIIPASVQGVSPECFASTATTAITVVTLDPPLGPNTVITLDVPPECSPNAESWPKMDKIPKPRGRPCTKQNFTQRKIALKRKRTCPKKFADLTEEAKIFLIIRATCTDTDTSTVITESCLKPVADFGDLVMDDRVDIEMVRPFFDTRAFSKLQYGVLTRKRDGPFSCGTCHEHDDLSQKMVMCEQCLLWFHFQCAGYRSKMKIPIWFCKSCMSGDVKLD
ncbi:hypothetical protein EGW08_008526 [Elysia chlorotica]|uniref:PHD-type domain-containing protein n=1 Tax=Elysia chlorotica TaxID=188477 RepID=A0A433TQE0_ELYCH|nr:hypothetical protein EGW08_008526 [Elysia chlorotica]